MTLDYPDLYDNIEKDISDLRKVASTNRLLSRVETSSLMASRLVTNDVATIEVR